MRILMTCDTVGGVWTYAIELARALTCAGQEVHLATMGEPASRAQRTAARRAGATVHESRYRLEWMDEPWADVAEAGQWLLDLERAVRPDVVHLNGYAHAAWPFEAPVLVVAHSCVWTWWRAVHGEDPPRGYDRYHEAVACGLRSADLVLAPTWAMLWALEACYGKLERMGVIANGRSGERFARGRKEPMVLAVGRVWDEAKNIALLEAAADRIDWPVHVAGEAAHPVTGEVRALSVHALGRLEEGEVAAWLGRASIYCLPAKYEPFGLSALEAALSGCALVLGDIPSLREVWGPAAVYVDPDDPVGLGRAVNALAGDERGRRKLRNLAQRRARRLTPGRMAQGYLRAYRMMIGPAPTGAAHRGGETRDA